MRLDSFLSRLLVLVLFSTLWAIQPAQAALATDISTQPVTTHKHTSRVHASHSSRHHSTRRAHAGTSSARVHTTSYFRRRRHRYYERFTTSSYAENQTAGDITAGEDPVVRQAAISALGDMNGAVVIIDPSDGRILAMLNQRLALSNGAEPCSTIKISVALAALEEGVITPDTQVRLGRRFSLNLADALAESNNAYFETLGRSLGFERVKHYANLFGLGELAGYNIPGEQLGVYPDHPLADSEGGVGRMCSFGQGISVTPLQLGALVAALANGGTLYYLQHPETPVEVASFQPRVKRHLNIAPILPAMKVGMADVVEFGTGRTVLANFRDFPVLGKTGTCSNNGTRLGWFASYADTPYGRLVAVFFLEGGRPTYGPKAAELAGIFYHNLQEQNYYTTMHPVEPSGQISSVSDR